MFSDGRSAALVLTALGALLLVGSGASAVQGYRSLYPGERIDAEVERRKPSVEHRVSSDRTSQPVKIRRGSTFGTLMSDYGLPSNELRRVALPHYDLATIRPDRHLWLDWVDGDPVPVALNYTLHEDATLRLEREGEVWTAHVDEIVYDSAPGERGFTITRSLWQDGLEAGLQPADLVRLAEIFEYEVDFNTELRGGAVFAAVGEVLTAPGRSPRLGALDAVRVRNGGQEWTAMRYVLPDGREEWYQESGVSLKKPFLRSPLEFSRVTSGFNPRRFHPVLKRRRPHNGTDFGAPTGTPVRVVADGLVVRAGWAGGHGRFVKVKHEGGFETSYSHLSSLSVRKGQRITQGTLVGRVGSTGLATGPHLHFQMWKNGRYVDAMKTTLPNQAPLPASERAAFKARWAELIPRLDATWEPLVD